MKKRLLFLIIVLISIKLNSFAQISYENSLYHLLSPIYNYYLIQKVSISKNKAHNKYVNFYDFTTTDINIKNDSLLKYSEEFDSLGNLIHNIEFNDTIKNKIKEDIYYKYDLKNNIIKVHDAINEEEYFCNNTYDSIGNLTKRKWLDYKGHLYSFETYKYDIDTNVILFMRFSKDSTLMEQNETFYYPNGKIKYSNYSNTLLGTNETNIYKYSKDFQKIVISVINQLTKKEVDRYTYFYKHNQIIKEIIKYESIIISNYRVNELNSKYYYDRKNQLWAIRKYYYTKF